MSGAFPEQTSALDAWASANVAGWSGPSSATEIRFRPVEPDLSDRRQCGRYVLRRKPPGRLLKSAHMIEREFRVLKALEGAGFPAPRALSLCEDEALIGTVFYLMAYVKGASFGTRRCRN